MQTPAPWKRLIQGFSTVGLLGAAAIVGLTLLGGWWAWRGQTLARKCEYNLLRIYQACDLYEIEHGALPSLALFPDDPYQDRDSFVIALEPYGVKPEFCVCPASPDFYLQKKVPYLWNPDVNGTKLRDPDNTRWMLVEVHALDNNVPPPHGGRYQVLYTDGRVVETKVAPPGLLEN